MCKSINTLCRITNSSSSPLTYAPSPYTYYTHQLPPHCLRYPAEECINKVGHGLHDLDSEFEKVSYEPRLGSITRELGLHKPLPVQVNLEE